MASWPATLPTAASVYGYSVQPIDQTIRTDMEVGSARVRRRTTNRQDKIALSWVFTDAQLKIFRDWFDDASTGIAGGSSWFTMRVPVGNTGLTSMNARFVGPVKIDHAGALNWSVSGTVEVR